MKKIGDTIYYLDYNKELVVDTVKEIVEIDGKFLITPLHDNWLTLEEDNLLDESYVVVQEYIALHTEKSIKLSDARNWLQHHLAFYYEPDYWSSFYKEEAIKDFCRAMVYNK